jgi:hypothetical protein
MSKIQFVGYRTIYKLSGILLDGPASKSESCTPARYCRCILRFSAIVTGLGQIKTPKMMK